MRLLNRWSEHVLSLFRVIVGLLFMCHGLASIFGFMGGHLGRGGAIPAGTWPVWWAALIQLVTGFFVLIGLGTRGAAVLASGSMAYAYFTVHQPRALLPIQNGGEASVMFCWAFLLIAFFGPGPWSLSELIGRVGHGADDRHEVAELDATA